MSVTMPNSALRKKQICLFVAGFAMLCAADAHRLTYRVPAEDSIAGWENLSTPIGNGWFGANLFGGIEKDRVQITHKAIVGMGIGLYQTTPGVGLTDAYDLRFEFPHAGATGYRRTLELESATATLEYGLNGVKFTREAFASYPDRVLVMRLSASERGELSFSVSGEVPYPAKWGEGNDLSGRKGTVVASGAHLDCDQRLKLHNTIFAARLRVETDGSLVAAGNRLSVTNATAATLYFACDSNYELFGKNPEKDVRSGVEAIVAAAVKKGYKALRAAHRADFASLFGRVSLNLPDTEADREMPMEELVAAARLKGRRSNWLNECHFQFGRYLLISSSRPSTLPANLQGTWNAKEIAPWGGAYFHNINVQMNYWPAFICNLADCFEAYADFNAAFRPSTRVAAINYLARTVGVRSDLPPPGADFWCIGAHTSLWQAHAPGGHSGPGTGGLTTKLYWDWWDYTHDRAALEKHVYPVLRGMADFLIRAVKETNGVYLAAFSASPEQQVPVDPKDPSKGMKHYNTVGCAFDQQMIAENNRDFLRAHDILGKPEDFLSRTVRAQVDKYDPVQIGTSGQIKEYREEGAYGEIGEPAHRHISQLVGLYPGRLINSDRPDWLAAARVSLERRGHGGTGWAEAHRLACWARAQDAEKAYDCLSIMESRHLFPNLFNSHRASGEIFQVDGNFGVTAGIAEMLLQSHSDGRIELLPALPKAWSKNGSFRGLCARGGYVVDCAWKGGRPVSAKAVPVKGVTGKPRFFFRGEIFKQH